MFYLKKPNTYMLTETRDETNHTKNVSPLAMILHKAHRIALS